MSDQSEDDKIPVMDTGLDRPEPMPEVNDNNVNSSFMLPRENTYARGKVIGQKILRWEWRWKGERQPYT